MDVQKSERSSGTYGFSLVGLLLVVLLLGALTAGAVVGVSSLTGTSDNTATLGTGVNRNGGTGNLAPSSSISSAAAGACAASAAAARAASSVYFATSGGSYPVKWSDLTASNPPTFALAEHVVINAGNPKELDGSGWKLIVSGGGTSAPTFTCRPGPIRPS